jgi:hypothetical protein
MLRESLDDLDNLPPPDVIAQEIVEDLGASRLGPIPSAKPSEGGRCVAASPTR